MIDNLIVFITQRGKNDLQLFNFPSLERNATGNSQAHMCFAVKVHRVLQQKVTKPTRQDVTLVAALVTSEDIK